MLLALFACTFPSDEGSNWEGANAGECADGADNDGDGAYDCDDTDCGGAPDCAESAGETGDADADADADADTDTDTVNHAPTSPAVTIVPSAPSAGDLLVCTLVTPSSDSDGDSLAYSVAWTRDGEPVEGAETTLYEDDTMPAAETVAVADATWTCTMTASDGELTASGSALALLPGTCDVQDVTTCGDDLAAVAGLTSDIVTDLGTQSACTEAAYVPPATSTRTSFTLTPRVEVCDEGGEMYTVSTVLRVVEDGHAAEIGLQADWPDGTQAILRRWYYDSADGNGAHATLTTATGNQDWLGDGESMGYDGWRYGWVRGMSAEGGWVSLQLSVDLGRGEITYRMYDPDTSSDPYEGTLVTSLADELPTFSVYHYSGYYAAPGQFAEIAMDPELWTIE
jgi:hypothetical protein